MLNWLDLLSSAYSLTKALLAIALVLILASLSACGMVSYEMPPDERGRSASGWSFNPIGSPQLPWSIQEKKSSNEGGYAGFGFLWSMLLICAILFEYVFAAYIG